MVQRRVQILGWALIWSGVFIFGYIGWQVFGTDLVNGRVQAREQAVLEDLLRDQTLEPEVVDPSDIWGPGEIPPGGDRDFQFTQELAGQRGSAFGFIRIPRIDVDQVVFAGTDVQTLKSGPGHMLTTPAPGQPGNAVISGHRTTYGAPFHNLDLLEAGDRIEVQTAAGVHVYEVRELEIVRPNDIWVTHHREGGWLTLTTCHPKFSARQRLIVFAEMVEGPNFEFIQVTAGL